VTLLDQCRLDLGANVLSCISFFLYQSLLICETMPPLSRGFRALRATYGLIAPRFPAFKRFQGTQSRISRNDFFKVSEEVQDALETRKPVVALETTIYTHGESNTIFAQGNAADHLLRLSLSRKCSSIITTRIASPSQWRNPRNHRHTQRCRTSRYGGRRTHRAGLECRQLQYMEDLQERFGLYQWFGNAMRPGFGNTF
jgi:hypothetical protein